MMKKILMFCMAWALVVGMRDTGVSANAGEDINYEGNVVDNTVECCIGGVEYHLFLNAKTAEAGRGYSENLEIPSKVIYKDTEFTVTKFDSDMYCSNRKGNMRPKEEYKTIHLPDTLTEVHFGTAPVTFDRINIPRQAKLTINPYYDIGQFVSDKIEVSEDHMYYTKKENYIYDKKDNTRIFWILDSGKQIVIPEGTKHVERIVFCKQGTSIVAPASLESIGEYIAISCASVVEKVDLSKTKLKEIPVGAFNTCFKLSDVALPATIQKIGINAFCSCSKLKSIKIPNATTQIDKYAFQNCISLKKIACNKKLKRIEFGAFARTAFTTIKIPSSVTYVGKYAFAGNRNLKKIYWGCKNKIPNIKGKYTFPKTKKLRFYMKSKKTKTKMKDYVKRAGYKNITVVKR